MENLLQPLIAASVGWDLKPAVASVARLFLWELRHAAEAELSVQRECGILREDLRQENDTMMLPTKPVSDLSGKSDERENEIETLFIYEEVGTQGWFRTN